MGRASRAVAPGWGVAQAEGRTEPDTEDSPGSRGALLSVRQRGPGVSAPGCPGRAPSEDLTPLISLPSTLEDGACVPLEREVPGLAWDAKPERLQVGAAAEQGSQPAGQHLQGTQEEWQEQGSSGALSAGRPLGARSGSAIMAWKVVRLGPGRRQAWPHWAPALAQLPQGLLADPSTEHSPSRGPFQMSLYPEISWDTCHRASRPPARAGGAGPQEAGGSELQPGDNVLCRHCLICSKSPVPTLNSPNLRLGPDGCSTVPAGPADSSAEREGLLPECDRTASRRPRARPPRRGQAPPLLGSSALGAPVA